MYGGDLESPAPEAPGHVREEAVPGGEAALAPAAHLQPRPRLGCYQIVAETPATPVSSGLLDNCPNFRCVDKVGASAGSPAAGLQPAPHLPGHLLPPLPLARPQQVVVSRCRLEWE